MKYCLISKILAHDSQMKTFSPVMFMKMPIINY